MGNGTVVRGLRSDQLILEKKRLRDKDYDSTPRDDQTWKVFFYSF